MTDLNFIGARMVRGSSKSIACWYQKGVVINNQTRHIHMTRINIVIGDSDKIQWHHHVRKYRLSYKKTCKLNRMKNVNQESIMMFESAISDCFGVKDSEYFFWYHFRYFHLEVIYFWRHCHYDVMRSHHYGRYWLFVFFFNRKKKKMTSRKKWHHIRGWYEYQRVFLCIY